MRKMLVLALDGVPYSLAKKLTENGVMPCLAALLRQGAFRPMSSVLPTVSSVAWSTFLTGRNPGHFGVFGFYELDHGLGARIPNRTWLGVPTILRQLSLRGVKVVSLGMPMTYPPEQAGGDVVGGFLSPDLEGAVHPPELLPILQSVGYRLDVDIAGTKGDPEQLRANSHACLEARERALLALMNRPWDFLACHVIETDRVNHYFWDEVEAYPGEEAGWVIGFYKAVDQLIGRAIQAAGPDSDVMVLSDHGFCRARCEVQLNKWLEDEGYLEVLGEPGQRSLQSLSPRSKAVALIPGRIHLLTPAFWRHGRVGACQREELLDEITSKLAVLKHPSFGGEVCKQILRGVELYEGPHAVRAPDLVIEPENGFDLKASLTASDIFSVGHQTGMHTLHDAFVFIRGPELPKNLFGIMDCHSVLRDRYS